MSSSRAADAKHDGGGTMSEVASKDKGAGGGRLALDTLGKLIGSSSSRGLLLTSSSTAGTGLVLEETRNGQGIIIMPLLDYCQKFVRHGIMISPRSAGVTDTV